jgi:hypothetical protein
VAAVPDWLGPFHGGVPLAEGIAGEDAGR